MNAIETATRYLDALISHDADDVPLADDVRRINNGVLSIEGPDALRAIIRREPAAATSAFRWLLDDDQAIVFYDLDADMKRGEGPVTSPPASWIPAYIGERFQVRDGLIEEIEVVYTAGPRPRPERPDRYPEAGASTGDGLAACKSYLASLVSHDASDVPLAPAVWRIENGKPSGDGADALRAALESEVMQSIRGTEDERWFVGGDGAAVFYTLRVGNEKNEAQVRIAERFRVVDGGIAEIEAVFAPLAP